MCTKKITHTYLIKFFTKIGILESVRSHNHKVNDDIALEKTGILFDK